MRVTMLETAYGRRLAVAGSGGWAVSRSAESPATVDELVHGGSDARHRAERAAACAAEVENPQFRGLCVPWPTKILCIGLNYRKHAEEAGLQLTKTPTIFSKYHNTLTGAGMAVSLPDNAESYDYEVELGVVIGRRAARVSEAEALDHVWGYCTCNDLSARDLQNATSQFLLGKTLDGFLPVGPVLVSADEVPDPQNLTVRTWLNGELRQDSTTADMVFSVAELVSYISRYIPLEVGDFIATGTPAGVIAGMPDPKQWMRPGDVVEVEVGGMGVLRTPLVAST